MAVLLRVCHRSKAIGSVGMNGKSMVFRLFKKNVIDHLLTTDFIFLEIFSIFVPYHSKISGIFLNYIILWLIVILTLQFRTFSMSNLV